MLASRIDLTYSGCPFLIIESRDKLNYEIVDMYKWEYSSLEDSRLFQRLLCHSLFSSQIYTNYEWRCNTSDRIRNQQNY